MGLGLSHAQLLEKYGPYVRSLAATVRKQFSSSLDLEDLMSYGQVGLLEAAERFDPKVGANFLTFAHYRIKGAIFDGLRKMGVLRGGDARNSYMEERAAAFLGNLSDRDTGGGNRRGSIDDDVRDISDAVTGLAMVFATGMEAADGLGAPDDSLPPDQRIELEQTRARVRAAIEELPEKERKLLQGYYFQGKTLEEAGAEIGQSKSWASRLHARAIEKLKEVLAAEDSLPALDNRRQADGGSHGRHSGLGNRDRPAETAAGSGSAAGQSGGLEVRRGAR